MKNIDVFLHLMWVEHEWNEEKITQFNSKSDYGIYQIYGDHPVYGENVLLYIGKARYQTYSLRLNQRIDFNESHISKFRRLHLSYFCKTEGVNSSNWGEYIDLAEKLLINAHFPAYNSQEIKGPIKNETFKKEMLIFNWNDRGKLLPEVSSLRYSYQFYDPKNLNFEKLLKEK